MGFDYIFNKLLPYCFFFQYETLCVHLYVHVDEVIIHTNLELITTNSRSLK